MESNKNREVNQNMELDKLIDERREEKRKVLKERLQNKLKTIRDRRISGVNNEPFPAGAFEQLQSNNIWEQVLCYLNDPTDVTSAYFACGTFAKILEERRMLMMLPKVLNVLKGEVDEAFEVKGQEMGNVWYQRWNSFCLNARGVCKAWKEIVDFHSKTTRDDWILRTEWTEEDNPRTNVFTFNDEKSIDQLTSVLTKRGLTVSPVRDIQVIFSDRMSESYYQKVLEYLKAHGGSVRFLFVYYKSPGNIAAGVREKLCDILKYLQNLKGLDIAFICEDHRPEETPDELQVPVFHQSSLPNLPSLKHFTCLEWERKEHLVSEILRRYPNLKTVDLFYTDPTIRETTEALMNLKLERFDGLPTIINSLQLNWPLKHLEINMGMEIDASILFPAINRFRETLEHLVIWESVRIDDWNVCLDLPCLKSIFLTSIRHGLMGFDQLLPLKSLEILVVWKVEDEDEDAKVKVKRYFDRGNLDRSNVWECFPYLKRLRLGLRARWFHRPQKSLLK